MSTQTLKKTVTLRRSFNSSRQVPYPKNDNENELDKNRKFIHKRENETTTKPPSVSNRINVMSSSDVNFNKQSTNSNISLSKHYTNISTQKFPNKIGYRIQKKRKSEEIEIIGVVKSRNERIRKRSVCETSPYEYTSRKNPDSDEDSYQVSEVGEDFELDKLSGDSDEFCDISKIPKKNTASKLMKGIDLSFIIHGEIGEKFTVF